MPNRITQNMINTNLLRNVNRNLIRMSSLQDNLATGRRINKPSDDPVGLSFAMRYRSEVSANEQYQENVDSAKSWLEFTDTLLDQAGSVLNRIRELGIQAHNGANPQSAMDAINKEITQLKEQLVSVGNSEFNGKHVFNGQLTDKQPYTVASASTQATDDGVIQFEVGVGVKLPINITGNEVFGQPYNAVNGSGTDNAFKVIDDLSTALVGYDLTGIQDALSRLDNRINAFLDKRAEIGAKLNRVDLADNRLKDLNTNLLTLQSKTEDVDVAQAITNMKTADNVYQASLSVGAQIIKPSLVDFLR